MKDESETNQLPVHPSSFRLHPSKVGARGIEPRYSCSQGTRITGFLDAAKIGEKGSNLHFLVQSQTAYR